MNKVIEERTKRTEWYRDARFGMFIHWGLYAIPARGEWVRSVEQIPHEDYCHLTEEFTAENYNPRGWARLAKKAGMKEVYYLETQEEFWEKGLPTLKAGDTILLKASRSREFEKTVAKLQGVN